MSSQSTIGVSRIRAQGFRGGGSVMDHPRHRLAALHEEVYLREKTDRELLHDDSFDAEWSRMANLSPDDFE